MKTWKYRVHPNIYICMTIYTWQYTVYTAMYIHGYRWIRLSIFTILFGLIAWLYLSYQWSNMNDFYKHIYIYSLGMIYWRRSSIMLQHQNQKAQNVCTIPLISSTLKWRYRRVSAGEIPVTWPFVQPLAPDENKENIKCTHCWLFVRENLWWPENSPKISVLWKAFASHDAICNNTSCFSSTTNLAHRRQSRRHFVNIIF